ncbi:MAG: hypothetical protein ACLRXC_11075 [[Clostridium] leptum]
MKKGNHVLAAEKSTADQQFGLLTVVTFAPWKAVFLLPPWKIPDTVNKQPY